MNNVTTDYCLDIIKKFEVSEENKVKNVLGIEGNALSFSFPEYSVLSSILQVFREESGESHGIIHHHPTPHTCPALAVPLAVSLSICYCKQVNLTPLCIEDTKGCLSSS